MNEELDSTRRDLSQLRLEIEALQLEEALLRADCDRLQQLYQRAPLGYQSLDENGCFLAVNQAWLDILGYAEEEVIGRSFGDFLHPEWQEHFRENFPRFKALGEILGVEFEMLRKDGRIISVAFDGRIGRDPEGRFQQTHCIFRDITARRAEETRNEAERRLLRLCHLAGDTRELVGGLVGFFQELTRCEAVGIRLRRGEDYPYYESRGFPDGFLRTENFLCQYTADGKVLREPDGNPVLECMCGNVLRGRFNPNLPFFTSGGSFWTNSTSELLKATSETDRQARTRNRCNGEGYESVALVPFRLRDETYGLLQFNDRAKGRFSADLIGQIEDLAAYVSLSLSKHLADSFRLETEEKYRLLVEHAHEGIIITAGQRLLLANPAAARLSGYPMEKLLLRSFADLVHPDDLAMVTAQHQRRLQGKIEPGTYSFRIIRADGEIRWVEVNGSLIQWQGDPATLNFVTDITERRQAEEALSANAHLLNATQRLTKAGGWEWDVSAGTMTWTEETYRIHEFDPGMLLPGSPEFVARSLACYRDEDRQVIAAAFRRCVESGIPYDLEFPFTTAKGSHIWIRTTAEAVWADGRIVKVIGNIVDITEQRRILDDLKIYANIVSSTSDGMAFLDTDYRYVIVNDVYELYSGVGRERFIGRTVAGYLGEELFRQQLKPLLDRCLLGESINYQGEFDYPKLGRRYMDVSYFPYRDGNGAISGIVVTTRDISDKRQREQQLRQQAMILDQIYDAVAVTDLAGNITYVNQASAAKLGRSREELIGRHVGIFGHDPEYGASQDQIVAMTLAHGRWQGEVVNFTPEGRRIMMDCRINTLFDEQGRKIGMCGISTDISEKRRTENLLQARLRLSEEAAVLKMDEFMQLALDEAEKLTGSRIGFFHFLEADQRTISLQTWSTATIRDFCRAEGRGLHYGLEQAGVWADAIRQRQPVIQEDVPNLPGLRKMPSGHAVVGRELVVPVMRGSLITAILGVGNKPQPYDQRDVELVSTLAGMVWDIVLQKRAEWALRASEERFRGIFAVSPAGIALADPVTQRFLRANRSFLEIVGYTEEELLEKQVGELTHPDDWIDEQRRIAEKRDHPGGNYSVEKRYIRKDGDIRWVQLMADYLQLEDAGQLLIANVIDITARKEAETALQQSLAEKEVLLREVHHRVKNNMAAIIGLFEMQRQGLDDPTAKTVLAELSSRVRAMSLVHEKLYRADSLDHIDFQEYIQAIVSHLRTSFGSPGIVCEIDAKGIGIPLDLAVPCGMIVNELVTNALKYAFPEGRAMRDAMGDRILVHLRRQDGSLVLSVADNGVGFAPGFDWRAVRSLGMVLIRTLGEHQLRGSFTVDGENGVCFALTFSLGQKEAVHG